MIAKKRLGHIDCDIVYINIYICILKNVLICIIIVLARQCIEESLRHHDLL